MYHKHRRHTHALSTQKLTQKHTQKQAHTRTTAHKHIYTDKRTLKRNTKAYASKSTHKHSILKRHKHLPTHKHIHIQKRCLPQTHTLLDRTTQKQTVKKISADRHTCMNRQKHIHIQTDKESWRYFQTLTDRQRHTHTNTYTHTHTMKAIKTQTTKNLSSDARTNKHTHIPTYSLSHTNNYAPAKLGHIHIYKLAIHTHGLTHLNTH